MKLYEIAPAYEALLEEYNSTIEDQVRDEIAAKLEALEVTKDDKLTACCAYFKNMEADLEIYENEVKRLREEKHLLEERIERFKKYLGNCIGEGTKWKSGVHGLSWRKSTRLELDPSKPVYPEFQKVIYEPDKDSIREHLEGGGTLPFAKLTERQNIQIR